ncbi:unnamed protein product [Blepharisma stoltei]|uniref:Uncharacterized protein n=1 Tax=Blepharisma stoltei TaxID=1481888 RepID=A0AAU9JCL6_9CILI|nr:unnamed protein product [Blepharisma stoltei]
MKAITSLEALRKLTKPTDSSKNPLEGFTKYLEKVSAGTLREEMTLQRRGFSNGIGLAKVKSILKEKQRKAIDKTWNKWRHYAVSFTLLRDPGYWEKQYTETILKAVRAIFKFQARKIAKAFYQWNLAKWNTVVPLYSILSKIFSLRKLYGIRQLKLVSPKSTHLLLTMYTNRINVYKQAFIRWKKETDKISQESALAQQVAFMRFKGFQNEKLIEVFNAYSKQIAIKKRLGFNAFKINKNEEYERTLMRDETFEQEDESIVYNKLMRQLNTHKEAATQAKVKSILLQTMLSILNN